MEDAISIKVECTGCGRKHENPVTLASESLKLDSGNNKWNLIIKCVECEHEMKLKLKVADPQIPSEDFDLKVNQLTEKEIKELSKFKGHNYFILGEIVCDLCNVTELAGILYKIYSQKGREYTPKLEERDTWIILEDGEEISIRDFNLELERIK